MLSHQGTSSTLSGHNFSAKSQGDFSPPIGPGGCNPVTSAPGTVTRGAISGGSNGVTGSGSGSGGVTQVTAHTAGVDGSRHMDGHTPTMNTVSDGWGQPRGYAARRPRHTLHGATHAPHAHHM